ncbi:GNAT family N-acetyltransferase [Archangium violaceum]|uniref:GNAT family N-acetyltransferase n=1 Tax=Archangium violaceum TaxID=83451 RepID=UPI00193BC59A|nr:GNAT family N-acetyltransferase [Archangium violaceum]QRK10107.1 GNAT family N-acetyltransferase [Archangium violaceum]
MTEPSTPSGSTGPSVMGWREATPADDDRIVSLCEALNREDPGPDPVNAQQILRTLATLRAQPTRGRTVVLDTSRGLASGYAFLIAFWSNELGGEVCVIDELFIEPAARGRGHGTRLVEGVRSGALFGKIPVAVELEVRPANTRALSLYHRLGFRPIETMRLRLTGSVDSRGSTPTSS